MHELDKGNELLDATYARRGKTAAVRPGTTLKVGVDLGTASIVVVVLDENDTVTYAQLVPEIADEPDYAAALAALA